MTDEKKPAIPFTIETIGDKPVRVEFPIRAPLGEINIVSPRERRAMFKEAQGKPGDNEEHATPARNPIDAQAEFEYAPNVVPPDRLPSPGAALRQLCRSISSHPNLKRLIEDHLAQCNSESQMHYRKAEGFKEQIDHQADELSALTEEYERLTEENNRLIKKLCDSVMTCKQLRAQVEEHDVERKRLVRELAEANRARDEWRKQVMAQRSEHNARANLEIAARAVNSDFVRELAAEFEAERADFPPAPVVPANIDSLGKAARASHLSLSHRPRRWFERIFPTRPPVAWEALGDDERSAWCAAALAAVLERDLALENAKRAEARNDG